MLTPGDGKEGHEIDISQQMPQRVSTNLNTPFSPAVTVSRALIVRGR